MTRVRGRGVGGDCSIPPLDSTQTDHFSPPNHESASVWVSLDAVYSGPSATTTAVSTGKNREKERFFLLSASPFALSSAMPSLRTFRPRHVFVLRANCRNPQSS